MKIVDFFRLASESYPNGKAVFWVDRECIEILLNDETNLINRITMNVLTKEKSVTDAMMWLCTISETNISDSLIPAIDVFWHKNIFGKFLKKHLTNEFQCAIILM